MARGTESAGGGPGRVTGVVPRRATCATWAISCRAGQRNRFWPGQHLTRSVWNAGTGNHIVCQYEFGPGLRKIRVQLNRLFQQTAGRLQMFVVLCEVQPQRLTAANMAARDQVLALRCHVCSAVLADGIGLFAQER